MGHAPPDANDKKQAAASAKKRAGWRETILETLERDDGKGMKKSAEVIAEILGDKNHVALGAALRVMVAITAPAPVSVDPEVVDAGDVVVVRFRSSPLEAAEAREKSAIAAGDTVDGAGEESPE